jgi:hypothetical protein
MNIQHHDRCTCPQCITVSQPVITEKIVNLPDGRYFVADLLRWTGRRWFVHYEEYSGYDLLRRQAMPLDQWQQHELENLPY